MDTDSGHVMARQSNVPILHMGIYLSVRPTGWDLLETLGLIDYRLAQLVH